LQSLANKSDIFIHRLSGPVGKTSYRLTVGDRQTLLLDLMSHTEDNVDLPL